MEQPYRNPFLLSDLECREQVTVPGYNGGVSDLVLSAQKRKVESQEKVSTLLMKDRPPIGTQPFIYQPAFPNSEPAEVS